MLVLNMQIYWHLVFQTNHKSKDATDCRWSAYKLECHKGAGQRLMFTTSGWTIATVHQNYSNTSLVFLSFSLLTCYLTVAHLWGWNMSLSPFSIARRIRSKFSTTAFMIQHGLLQLYVPPHDSDPCDKVTLKHSHAFLPSFLLFSLLD